MSRYGIEIWNTAGSEMLAKKPAKDPDRARAVLKSELLKLLQVQPETEFEGLMLCDDEVLESYNNEEILEAASLEEIQEADKAAMRRQKSFESNGCL